MLIRKDRDFISCFDEKSGKYFRTGQLTNGRDSGKDPFMASFPELLDVGIMGHCAHGRTGLCLKAGVECYQDGFHSTRDNMNLDDFRDIAEQCCGRTYQFALGGCGDPDQHEHFFEILKICRENRIVPNFTTSGFGMTEEIAIFCKEYCGAVAVSWYRSHYTDRAIQMLISAGVKTNIHYILNRDTIYEALLRVKKNDFPQGINAVIFLLHKPIGLGSYEKIVRKEDSHFWELLDVISTFQREYKIGFDSCTFPALLQHTGQIDIDSLDTCEGARWSAYITADMKMLPCSFDNQEQRWAVNLREFSIEKAWNSTQFEDFRHHLKNSCPNCKKRELCRGGCPICKEIILCNEVQKIDVLQNYMDRNGK